MKQYKVTVSVLTQGINPHDVEYVSNAFLIWAATFTEAYLLARLECRKKTMKNDNEVWLEDKIESIILL